MKLELAKDWNDAYPNPLNAILGDVLEGVQLRMPASCPCCGAASIHIYFHRHDEKRRGGVWIWCDSCRRTMHGSLRVPAWWRNLETVRLSDLTSHPVVLDTVRALVDEHWNRVEEQQR